MLLTTCLLVSLDGVFEANHVSCAMISGAPAIPDLMSLLMAVPSLMIGLPCFLAVLLHDESSSLYFLSDSDPENDNILPSPEPEDRNDSDDDEDLFPSSSDDEANLFDSFNNEVLPVWSSVRGVGCFSA